MKRNSEQEIVNELNSSMKNLFAAEKAQNSSIKFLKLTDLIDSTISYISINNVSMFHESSGTLILNGVTGNGDSIFKVKADEIMYVKTILDRYLV